MSWSWWSLTSWDSVKTPNQHTRRYAMIPMQERARLQLRCGVAALTSPRIWKESSCGWGSFGGTFQIFQGIFLDMRLMEEILLTCWWLVVYPIIYKVLYIPGGCKGFLPWTVWCSPFAPFPRCSFVGKAMGGGEINSSARGLFRLAQLTGHSSTIAPGACKRRGWWLVVLPEGWWWNGMGATAEKDMKKKTSSHLTILWLLPFCFSPWDNVRPFVSKNHLSYGLLKQGYHPKKSCKS